MERSLDILPKSAIVIRWKVYFPFVGEEAMKNRLEELRKKNEIKQEDLAAALEVSRQTIGSLENGRYNPSILLAFKLAKFFGVTIEEIFIYEEEVQ
jgi:putative transcriptional regulator